MTIRQVEQRRHIRPKFFHKLHQVRDVLSRSGCYQLEWYCEADHGKADADNEEGDEDPQHVINRRKKGVAALADRHQLSRIDEGEHDVDQPSGYRQRG